MVTRQTFAAGVFIGTLIAGSACSPRESGTMTSPSAIAEPSYRAIAVTTPSDAAFPPRNEPILFRTNLEAKYRDGLHREPTTSYVDIEGTIVWTQEYLRYRINQCGQRPGPARPGRYEARAASFDSSPS